jgi:hypothetical protein
MRNHIDRHRGEYTPIDGNLLRVPLKLPQIYQNIRLAYLDQAPGRPKKFSLGITTNQCYFLEAPKFVRIFLESFESVSLSSPFFFAFLVAAPNLLPEVAEVGVALFEVASFINEVLIGVGRCDGVVCEDESLGESCTEFC